MSINLARPAGFCELIDREPSDKRMLTVLTDIVAKSGNRLLGMTADCRQLTDWRTDKRNLLDDMGQYQTPIAQMDKPTAEPVKQTCATLRAQGDKLLAKQMTDIKSRVESALEKVKINSTSFMGVLAEDPTACYGALLQKLRADFCAARASPARLLLRREARPENARHRSGVHGGRACGAP